VGNGFPIEDMRHSTTLERVIRREERFMVSAELGLMIVYRARALAGRSQFFGVTGRSGARSLFD